MGPRVFRLRSAGPPHSQWDADLASSEHRFGRARFELGSDKAEGRGIRNESGFEDGGGDQG